MEFFRQTNLNWMGKAKYFFGLSGLLLAIGVFGLIRNGMTYGIDFKGGTLVTVRFAQAPDVDSIRRDLQARGLGRSSIVAVRDLANPNANEVQIGLEGSAANEQDLDSDKALILTTLRQSFPSGETGKQDFNAAT